MKNCKVVVIGCGVSGLTCGIRLLEQGYNVSIITKETTPNTTSDKAAAIWYPYRTNDPHLFKWCKETYQKFQELSDCLETGVFFTEIHNIFYSLEPDPEWKSIVTNFRRLRKEELPSGYIDGYASMVPIIEVPLYMPFLVNKFLQLNGKIDCTGQKIKALSELYENSPLIVNCTGLGARKLCNDKALIPVRGQVIKVRNPGIKRSIVFDTDPEILTYIIPRSTDCILGGTDQEFVGDDQEKEEDENIDPIVSKEILYRCQQLEPKLLGLIIEEVKVGLRPVRNTVRLEIERISNTCVVIHNYGHGGAGFTLSWGCANSVVNLANDLINS